ncbi:MAG: LysR family transcriptional regulator [Bdellovibrionota bacterium]
MSLNYNHLLYFYTAVNSGSLKGAAEHLRLSPSTISEQITELEGYFGKNLFKREKGKLSLTGHGQTAYQYAKTIFTAGERLKYTMKGNPADRGTPVEIGVNTSVTDLFERDLFLPLFAEEETKIRLRIGEMPLLTDDLFSYNLDVVLSEKLMKEARGIKREVIQSPSYSIVMSSKLKSKGIKGPTDLAKIPFIHYTLYSGVKWEIDQYFLKHGVKPVIVGEVDDTGLMKSAVLKGIAFAILPTAVVKDEVRNGDLVSLGIIPDLDIKVYAYYHAKDPTKQIKAVIDYLRVTLHE